MVHPEVRNKVPDKHVGPAIGVSKVVQHRSDSEETQVTEQDEFSILGFIQGAARVEVVDTREPAVGLALATSLRLLLVVVVSRNVGKEIHRPSEELLKEEVGSSQDRSFLHQVAQFVSEMANSRGIGFTRLGNEHHVTGHVGSRLVVLAVGDFPGEIWDQQRRVEDETDGVVEDLGWREGLVTTLVGQNPDTRTEQTLENGVQSPQSRTNRQRRDILGSHIVVEYIKSGAEVEYITGDVCQTLHGRSLEAMLGNSVTELLDRVIGNLELVAISVE